MRKSFLGALFSVFFLGSAIAFGQVATNEIFHSTDQAYAGSSGMLFTPLDSPVSSPTVGACGNFTIYARTPDDTAALFIRGAPDILNVLNGIEEAVDNGIGWNSTIEITLRFFDISRYTPEEVVKFNLKHVSDFDKLEIWIERGEHLTRNVCNETPDDGKKITATYKLTGGDVFFHLFPYDEPAWIDAVAKIEFHSAKFKLEGGDDIFEVKNFKIIWVNIGRVETF